MILGAGCVSTKIRVCKCWWGKNLFLTPAHEWIHECIQDWHLGMDLEVGSSLEYEYNVTNEAAKTARYSPCVRRSLGGVSGRILGGRVRWVVGWVCGWVFFWCEKAKALSLGRVTEICLGCEWVLARGN